MLLLFILQRTFVSIESWTWCANKWATWHSGNGIRVHQTWASRGGKYYKTTFHLGSGVRAELGRLRKGWPGTVECIKHEQAEDNISLWVLGWGIKHMKGFFPNVPMSLKIPHISTFCQLDKCNSIQLFYFLGRVRYTCMLLTGIYYYIIIWVGSTFRKKPWGQLAPRFSDLVASKNISVKSVKS